jgi:tetratricopeptide (TPR) repeat protein
MRFITLLIAVISINIFSDSLSVASNSTSKPTTPVIKLDNLKSDSLGLIVDGDSSKIEKVISDYYLEGNRLYRAGEFDSALTAYGKYLESNGSSATIYYNMGNSAYRAGRNGEAILFYERAKLYAPDDKDIDANIRFVASELVDDIQQPEKSIVSISLDYIHNLFPLSIEVYIVIMLSFLLLFFIYLALFRDSNYRMWVVYGIAIIVIFLSLVATSATVKILKLERIKHGVVLSQEVDAYSAPEGKTLIFTAHEGTSFEIRKSNNNWYYIVLPNGVSGWIPSDSAAVVEEN